MRLTLMNLTLLIAVVHTVISVVYTKANDNRLRFRLGSTTVDFDVTAEAYEPQGLKVFVSHRAGLEFLTFHGKIVTSKGEDRGNFAKDIIKNTNDQWVFEDERKRLRIGDTLHFWIFIQYKGTGQQFHDLVYKITNLTPGPINISPRQDFTVQDINWQTTPSYASRKSTTPRRKPQVTSDCTCTENTLTDIWAKMNSTVEKILVLEESISPLKHEIKSLKETIDELIDIENVGTNLLLTGDLPAQTNPVEDVRHLLIEKLHLKDLSNSIIQAKYVGDNIAFDVKSSIDKLRILKRSRDILSNLKFKIVDPNRRDKTEQGEMFTDDLQIDARFGDDDPNENYMSPAPKASIKIHHGVEAA